MVNSKNKIKQVLDTMESMGFYMDWDETMNTGIIYLKNHEEIRYNEINYTKISQVIDLLKYFMDGSQEDAKKGLKLIENASFLKYPLFP
jgi:hypothetical protein